MSKVTPFYAADQALVDYLCGIIEKLVTNTKDWDTAAQILTDEEVKTVEKIMS